MNKRIFAIILCFVLLLGCLPAASAATVTEISDKAGFAAIANNLKGSYKLTTDIIFTPEDFAEGGVMYGKLPFATSTMFTGTLDGNGYALVGLQSNTNYTLGDSGKPTGTTMSALFGNLSGTVKNLQLKNTVTNFNFTLDTTDFALVDFRVGAIASTVAKTGIISNCAVDGFVDINGKGKGRLNVGGIAGLCQGKISDCAVYTNIIIRRNYDVWTTVGAIAGHLDTTAATAERCYTNADIAIYNPENAKNTHSGALVGYNTGTVSKCYYPEKYSSATGTNGIYAGVSGQTTDCVSFAATEIAKPETYTYLDFTNLWAIQTVDGAQQPCLQMFACEHTSVGEMVTVLEANCGQEGRKEQRCNLCHEVIVRETIPATGNHTKGEIIVDKLPTCVDEGSGYKDCTVCFQIVEIDIVIPATGVHTPAEEVTTVTAPTCVAEGVGKKLCTVCGGDAETGIVIPATGEHTPATEVTTVTAPTCAVAGVGKKVCTVCGGDAETGIVLPATGNHSWDKGVVTKKPTSKDTGIKTYTCTICGATKTETLATVGVDVLTIFTDIKKSDWFVKNGAIDFVYNEGLFSGITKTTFGPNENMTRGMFVTVLGRLHGVSSKGATTQFTDVKKKDYFSGYVAWAAKNGIVTGTSATTFAPNANVTREQICAMMVRYCNFAKIKLAKVNAPIAFTDAKKISSYARSAVAACQQGGVVGGEKDGNGYRFRPQGNASRAEVATIMMNFSKNYMSK